jgi:hypothetical protein
MSAARIQAVLAAMLTVMAAEAPARVVTGAFLPFDVRPDAELRSGVITVLFAGVKAYDYEHSGSYDGVDHDQTGNALLEFTVTGQMRVPEGTAGDQVAAAEIALLGDIERLANAGLEHEDLVELRIVQAATSQQLEAPYLWVATTFQTRTDGA